MGCHQVTTESLDYLSKFSDYFKSKPRVIAIHDHVNVEATTATFSEIPQTKDETSHPRKERRRSLRTSYLLGPVVRTPFPSASDLNSSIL
jgi:hypothetical protein